MSWANMACKEAGSTCRPARISSSPEGGRVRAPTAWTAPGPLPGRPGILPSVIYWLHDISVILIRLKKNRPPALLWPTVLHVPERGVAGGLLLEQLFCVASASTKVSACFCVGAANSTKCSAWAPPATYCGPVFGRCLFATQREPMFGLSMDFFPIFIDATILPGRERLQPMLKRGAP